MSNPAKPRSYQPPVARGQIRLPLNRNESCTPLELPAAVSGVDPAEVTRYPAMRQLQESIGNWLQVPADQIVISAGGDDALERVIRIAIAGGRSRIVTHAPSFEMVDIYAENHGGHVDSVEWLAGDFPARELIEKIDARTGAVVLVSPNNPTGAIIPLATILEIAAAAKQQGAIVLVDHAYIEFADSDPIHQLLPHDHILILRSFSKAWGMAGLRVGYLVCSSSDQASTYRAATGPFPVSGVSMALARQAIESGTEQMQENVRRIRQIRSELEQVVHQCGGRATASQGNFVLARFDNANQVWDGLSCEGIAVRKFDPPMLNGYLRITCPTNAADLLHFAKALGRVTNTRVDTASINADVASRGEPVAPDPDPSPSNGTGARGDEPGVSPGTIPDRTARHHRQTKETDIELELNLDGSGRADIQTGIGFLDHMLTALTFHSRMDLRLRCVGDLHIDDHHTAEDCALALGAAIDRALGERKGIVRFGYACAPLDESLARTVIDLSGRPWPEIHLGLKREMVGTIASENITHVLVSLAMSLKCSLHVDVLRGTNDHHRAEAAFKSLALALRQAIQRTTAAGVPSTKGVL